MSFNAYSTDCEKPKMPTDDEWSSWLSAIKKEALNIGCLLYTSDAADD